MHTSPKNRRGVARIAVTGPILIGDLSTLRAQYATTARQAHRAIVFDCRNAVLQKEASPTHGTPTAPAAGADTTPVAIVCAPRDESAFIAHAWAMAKRGRTRAVFTRMGDAVVWARARAELAGQV